MSRAKLKGEIGWRIRFIIIDCTTYIKVRTELKEWYDKNQPDVGGGNFFMAHGLFSGLNFMGKVYARLKFGDKYFYTEEHKATVRAAVAQLKSASVQKAVASVTPELDLKHVLANDATTRWKPPRVDDCTDETGVFRIFYKAFRPTIDLGFPESASDDVWKHFRNRLSHMAAPGKVIETGGDIRTMKAFRVLEEEWRVNVDRLTVDTAAIEKWLNQEIDNHDDEMSVRDTLSWVDRELYPLNQDSTKTSTTTTTTTTTFTSTSATLSQTHVPPDSEK